MCFTQRYWVVNWTTFFVVSLVCWLLGLRQYSSNADYIVIGIALALLLLSLLATAFILRSLIRGRFSYDEITRSWKYVLNK
jgi:ABC-type uncharacterized transport system permease subunit